MQLKRNKEMEFETLKKNYKKQITIGAIAVCIIGGALTFNLTRAKYKVDKSIDLAKGIINYKTYDFKIMAMYKSEDGSNYTEITDRMPSSGYVINESKSYCTINNKVHDTNVVLKTIDGNHVFNNLAKSDKCYLYFDKYIPPTGSEIIIANLGTSIKTTTPDFSKIAITDEGVYSVSDGMYGGTSYYWRGAATTNYVKFANFCWRIVRINGDGSLRLIYDGTTCHSNGASTAENIAIVNVHYNTIANQSNYAGWTYVGTSQRTLSGTASNAKSQVESWYASNVIGTNATKVANGKFCNDRNVQSGDTWAINGSIFYYASYKRIYKNYTPTLSCLAGDVYTLSVGLITADEVMYAGGKEENNTSYYLYNGQNYWTMSPYIWYENNVGVYFLASNGRLTNGYVSSTNAYGNRGLRPVINLKSDVTFSDGDGTLNNPYIVQ